MREAWAKTQRYRFGRGLILRRRDEEDPVRHDTQVRPLADGRYIAWCRSCGQEFGFFATAEEAQAVTETHKREEDERRYGADEVQDDE
jgi:hypothetical protein